MPPSFSGAAETTSPRPSPALLSFLAGSQGVCAVVTALARVGGQILGPERGEQLPSTHYGTIQYQGQLVSSGIF